MSPPLAAAVPAAVLSLGRATAVRRTLLLALTSVLLATAAGAQPKLLFVGDSITAGIGATDPGRDGFVARIAARFPELRVAEAGCGGSTLRDWTIDGRGALCPFGNAWNLLAAPELPARITHIMLGTNDALGFFEHFGPLSPEEYELRLRMLVERSPGLVLVSSPPANPAHVGDAVDERLRAYRERIERVVRDHAFVRHGVDAYALLDVDTDFFGGGLHPNDRGHARLADALERRLLWLLPRGFLVARERGRRFEEPDGDRRAPERQPLRTRSGSLGFGRAPRD